MRIANCVLLIGVVLAYTGCGGTEGQAPQVVQAPKPKMGTRIKEISAGPPRIRSPSMSL
jgi:hypothetical protein